MRKKPVSNMPAESASPGGDDLPYIYAGILIVGGHGHAVVQATGERNEVGKTIILINGMVHGNWLEAFLGGIAVSMSCCRKSFPWYWLFLRSWAPGGYHAHGC